MRNNLKIIFLIIKTNTHTVELLSFPPAVRFFVSLIVLGVEGGVYSDIFLFSSFFPRRHPATQAPTTVKVKSIQKRIIVKYQMKIFGKHY